MTCLIEGHVTVQGKRRAICRKVLSLNPPLHFPSTLLLYVLILSLKTLTCFSTKCPVNQKQRSGVGRKKAESAPGGPPEEADAGAGRPASSPEWPPCVRSSALAPPSGQHASDREDPTHQVRLRVPRTSQPCATSLDLPDCHSPSRSRRPQWPRRAAASPLKWGPQLRPSVAVRGWRASRSLWRTPAGGDGRGQVTSAPPLPRYPYAVPQGLGVEGGKGSPRVPLGSPFLQAPSRRPLALRRGCTFHGAGPSPRWSALPTPSQDAPSWLPFHPALHTCLWIWWLLHTITRGASPSTFGRRIYSHLPDSVAKIPHAGERIQTLTRSLGPVCGQALQLDWGSLAVLTRGPESSTSSGPTKAIGTLSEVSVMAAAEGARHWEGPWTP